MLKVSSILLSYPESTWLCEVPSIVDYVQKKYPESAPPLNDFFDYLQSHDEISLQESYVNTFDRNSRHALHLFEHLHGEDRERGQAMVDLLSAYQKAGFEPSVNELPDYLPLFLEFLSQVDEQTAENMLADAVHVIHYVAENLRKNESIYSPVLSCIVSMSKQAPEPLQVAPVRDMDEAMQVFGPNVEGVEPLLRPTMQAVQPIAFYPQTK